MKISRIEIRRLELPVVRPHAMAIGTTIKLVDVFVRVFADDGTVGVGESPFMVGHSQAGETPKSAVAVLSTRLAPAVMGMSPLDQGIPDHRDEPSSAGQPASERCHHHGGLRSGREDAFDTGS